MTQDHAHLRTTFDQNAVLYDQIRPGYPEALFDDMVTLSGLPAGGSVLEIGSGTGKATAPMAQRGYRIQGIELGANMAAIARRNLAAYSHVTVYTGAFEDWPAEEAAFDLAFFATAFHWIDPTISYQKTAQALKPTGALALFWHVHVQSEASQGFFRAIDPIYQRADPNYQPMPWPDEITESAKAEIEQTDLFGEVTVRRYRWDATYDTASYLQLLDTYSNHRSLDSEIRSRLFNDLAQLIETRFNGHVTKGYLAMLYVAHRK